MSVSSAVESRIQLLERDSVPEEIGAIYDKLLAERGVVPNMFKGVANVPAPAAFEFFPRFNSALRIPVPPLPDEA
jgi:hypothetical protein